MYRRAIVFLIFALLLNACGSDSDNSLPEPQSVRDSSAAIPDPGSTSTTDNEDTDVAAVGSVETQQLPQPNLEITSSCPSFDQEVAPNSHFTFSFSDATMPVGWQDEVSVSMQCGNKTVSGVSSWEESTIRYVPDQLLNSGEKCSLIIESAGEVINLIDEIQITEEEVLVSTFSDPIALGSARGTIQSLDILIENETIVLFSTLGLKISHDGGKTFIDAPVHTSASSAILHDGELYLTYAVLPNNRTSEVYFLRSFNNITEFSIPALLSNPADSKHARQPSIAVDNANNINIVWEEICTSTSTFFCKSEHEALQMISMDSNGELIKSGVVADHTATTPQLVTHNGQTYLGWIESIWTREGTKNDYTIKLFNYSNGMKEVISQPLNPVGNVAQLRPLLSLDDGRLQLIWSENGAGFSSNLYSMSIDKEESVVEKPFVIWRDFFGLHSYTSIPKPGGKDILSWTESHTYHDQLIDQYKVTLYNTADGTAITHDIAALLPEGDNFENVKDRMPAVGVKDDGTMYLAWAREDERDDSIFLNRTLYFSEGKLAPPCAAH